VSLNFTCLQCDEEWEVPPHVHCPTCGPNTPARVPDPVWDVGWVPGFQIAISGHLLSPERTDQLYTEHGIRGVIDLAHDPDQAIVWRPSRNLSENARIMREVFGLEWVPIWGVRDTRTSKPFSHSSLTAFVQSLDDLQQLGPVLVHCAAGTRARSTPLSNAPSNDPGFSPPRAGVVRFMYVLPTLSA
jgi:protein tyrosine phosphatase (PTP) superfamily phosphohydrolase (DUF442 family)